MMGMNNNNQYEDLYDKELLLENKEKLSNDQREKKRIEPVRNERIKPSSVNGGSCK
jgi:hypothetical protein